MILIFKFACRWHCGSDALLSAIKALVTRLIFLTHALVALWRTAYVFGGDRWLLVTPNWLLPIPHCLLVVETIVVMAYKRGEEWRW